MEVSREKDHAIAEMIAKMSTGAEMQKIQQQANNAISAANEAVNSVKGVKPDESALIAMCEAAENVEKIQQQANNTMVATDKAIKAVKTTGIDENELSKIREAAQRISSISKMYR